MSVLISNKVLYTLLVCYGKNFHFHENKNVPTTLVLTINKKNTTRTTATNPVLVQVN